MDVIMTFCVLNQLPCELSDKIIFLIRYTAIRRPYTAAGVKCQLMATTIVKNHTLRDAPTQRRPDGRNEMNQRTGDF